jgi:hypothetical protein
MMMFTYPFQTPGSLFDNGHGRPKKDILEFRGDHGTVCRRLTPPALQEEVLVMVHPRSGMISTICPRPWGTPAFPQPGVSGAPFSGKQSPFLPPELGQGFFHLDGDVLHERFQFPP